MGVVVGGVILDESVLLAPQHDDKLLVNALLQTGAESLLRKLRHSKFRTGISYGLGLSDHKVSLLKRMATIYSCDCFILNASSIDDAKHEIMLAWGDIGGSILYLISSEKKEAFPKLSKCSWLIVVLRSLGQESADVIEDGSACENSSLVYINKLEELPSTACHLNRKAIGNSIVTVGYIMKPSREDDFSKVDNFNELDLVQRLSDAKLSLPSIVKPQVACGVANAHNMAIVFRKEDFKDLSVPLPAVVQEYVDHSSTLYKFYVLGEKVFYAVKKSTPNADILMTLSESSGLKPLVFDSLKSLPTANEDQRCGSSNCSKATNHSIELELVTDAANWLMRTLDLTIFGFDVVIQDHTGDHVIVDVNYLPSFKEVPDDIAIPAFWNAIKKKFESRKLN